MIWTWVLAQGENLKPSQVIYPVWVCMYASLPPQFPLAAFICLNSPMSLTEASSWGLTWSILFLCYNLFSKTSVVLQLITSFTCQCYLHFLYLFLLAWNPTILWLPFGAKSQMIEKPIFCTNFREIRMLKISYTLLLVAERENWKLGYFLLTVSCQ